MLTIYGNKSRFCDGVSRRNFLKIGSLVMGGLTLPQLLRAEAQSGIRKSHKAVIMIFLPGGPSHQDMFDLKLDAPSEIRGEFNSIAPDRPHCGCFFPKGRLHTRGAFPQDCRIVGDPSPSAHRKTRQSSCLDSAK